MYHIVAFQRHPTWCFVFFEWLLQEGERGYLEGLASRYADLFRTHYGDVLEPLEELRRRETNASPRMPNTQLTTSHSQPIYVPGKYSVSKSVFFFLFLLIFLCPFYLSILSSFSLSFFLFHNFIRSIWYDKEREWTNIVNMKYCQYLTYNQFVSHFKTWNLCNFELFFFFSNRKVKIPLFWKIWKI